MGRVVGRLLALAIVTVVGHIALCAAYGGPNQYVLNYGVELSELEQQIPVKAGLAWGHYLQSCADAEKIITTGVESFLKKDPGVAAGLLRLIFHDCFVQGCDASILLKLPSGTELDDVPNQTIRPIALQLVDDVKAKLEKACPKTVSCADIIVLASKVAVEKVGGPKFNVPLGRRDSLTFSAGTRDLPAPTTTFAQQSAAFGIKGLDTRDLVALAGGHTLGNAHCAAFQNRLFPTVAPKLNRDYANYLKANVCPTPSNNNATGLDFYTPNKFDNQYFKNLPTGGALMDSDQNLDQDATAWGLVNDWAKNQQNFFNQFIWSFVKMSQVQTLTGSNGEIRKVCSTTNSGKVTDSSIEMPVTESEVVPETVELLQATTSREPELISMVV